MPIFFGSDPEPVYAFPRQPSIHQLVTRVSPRAVSRRVFVKFPRRFSRREYRAKPGPPRVQKDAYPSFASSSHHTSSLSTSPCASCSPLASASAIRLLKRTSACCFAVLPNRRTYGPMWRTCVAFSVFSPASLLLSLQLLLSSSAAQRTSKLRGGICPPLWGICLPLWESSRTVKSRYKGTFTDCEVQVQECSGYFLR